MNSMSSGTSGALKIPGGRVMENRAHNLKGRVWFIGFDFLQHCPDQAHHEAQAEAQGSK